MIGRLRATVTVATIVVCDVANALGYELRWLERELRRRCA